MATDKEYADFILDKFSGLDGVVTIRPMMGEYVIHMAGKVLGFLGDGQLLLEPGPTIATLLPDAERRELFPGSKLVYVIDDSISSYRLCELARAIYDDLPVSKPRKGRAKSVAGTRPGTASEGTAAENTEAFPFARHVKE